MNVVFGTMMRRWTLLGKPERRSCLHPPDYARDLRHGLPMPRDFSGHSVQRRIVAHGVEYCDPAARRSRSSCAYFSRFAVNRREFPDWLIAPLPAAGPFTTMSNLPKLIELLSDGVAQGG
jgi:hypothetical protein